MIHKEVEIDTWSYDCYLKKLMLIFKEVEIDILKVNVDCWYIKKVEEVDVDT